MIVNTIMEGPAGAGAVWLTGRGGGPDGQAGSANRGGRLPNSAATAST